jgi:hypothetical protein
MKNEGLKYWVFYHFPNKKTGILGNDLGKSRFDPTKVCGGYFDWKHL